MLDRADHVSCADCLRRITTGEGPPFHGLGHTGRGMRSAAHCRRRPLIC